MNLFEFAENIQNYSTDKFMNDLSAELDSNQEVLDLQLSQWDKGEDSNGQVLGYYTKMTEILSGGKKKEGDRYNLLDTGSFRASTYLLPMEKSNDLVFDFDSSDSKTSELIQKIGPSIFGLQDKNIERFTLIAIEKAKQILNTNLKLK